MKTTISLFIFITGILSGLFTEFFTLPEGFDFLFGDGGLTLGFALGALVYNDIAAEVLVNIRRWHGKAEDQYNNLANLVDTFVAHKEWEVPVHLVTQLTDLRDQLTTLMAKCKGSYASAADRTLRNALLKTAVGICLTQAKIWAISQYYAGVLTATDVHLLGFFLPGDAGGFRARTEASEAVTSVKVAITHMDNINVVIDHAYKENAGQVEHGWPEGVRNALIVILSADGKREIYRQMTSHLHTPIELPKDTRGKQLIAKAAFMKHVDDKPKFGSEPIFSMPLNAEDLADTLDQQHHQEFEDNIREIERRRQEVEQMEKDFNERKARENK